MAERMPGLFWEDIRSDLVDNARIEHLRYCLKQGQALSQDQLLTMNLLFQDAIHESNIRASERFAGNSLRIADSNLRVSRTLKNATIILAIATAVLAISAAADILLRVFCGK